MDFLQIFSKIAPNCGYILGVNGDLSYNGIKWKSDNSIPQPTLEECEAAWQEIINEAPLKKLREERDNKLLQTDKYSITDWPHPTEEIRQAWITYRKQLRDLPQKSLNISLNDQNELIGVEWPTPPQ
jgi:hypothetical protein